jgi:hypothetical protein
MSEATGMMNDPQALRCLLYLVVLKYGGDVIVEIPQEVMTASQPIDMGNLIVDDANGPHLRIYIEAPENLNG